MYAIDLRMMNYDLKVDLAVKNFNKYYIYNYTLRYLNKLEDFLNNVFMEL